MRRWIWLLGLLVVGIAGTVWWSSRNAVRLEPLDAQRFAQMSETEQVEWLIEQVLARSKRTGMLTDIANNLPFARPTEWQPLLPRHIEAIGMACVEYDLPHWLNFARRYMHQETDREHLMVYQAILQARKGDWQAAERTVQKIRTDTIRVLGWAHLGRLYAEAGRSDAAQRSFDHARAIFLRPADPMHSLYLLNTLTLIISHSSVSERSETAAEFVRGLPDEWRASAVWRVSEYYRQRGDVGRLRAFIALVPESSRREVEMYLVRTLIGQGQVEHGLRLLARLGECRDVELAQIARALHKRGRTQDAQTFADALRTRLLQDGFLQGQLNRRAPDTLRLSTPYGEVRVILRFDYSTTHLLVQAYTEWGQPEAAEQLIAAVPIGRFRVLQRTNMAHAYHKIGQQAQARQHLERARTEGQGGARRIALKHRTPVGTSIEIGCAAAFCGEPALALEVADTIPLSEQRDILGCMLRAYARRNAFWEALMGFP
jgi:tetratricopeptide (TPR) repeat protein